MFRRGSRSTPKTTAATKTSTSKKKRLEEHHGPRELE
jgi:hypothetical protein